MKPEYYTWEDRGKTYTQITARTKQAILAGYALRYSLRTFVETGSCNGDCLLALHGLFEHSYSVELLESQFRFTQDKLHKYPDISLYNGDSAVLLPGILEEVRGKGLVLFWLDAHGDNWIGPVVQELEAIFASEVKGAILIDDMDYITDKLPENADWEKSEEYGIVRLVHRTL